MPRIMRMTTVKGQPIIQAVGVPGPECQQFTARVIAAMGIVEESTPTEEMYDQCPIPETEQES